MEQKENNKLENYNRLKSNETVTIFINNFKRPTNCKKNKIFFLFFIIVFISLYILEKSTNYAFSSLFIKNNNLKKHSHIISKLKQIIKDTNPLYDDIQKCLIRDPDEELCIYQFLCPKKVKGKKRILLGNKRDGSYVMLNDFKNITIAYSIGIRDLIQFDKALADRNIDVYMYDHTNNKLPYENKRFHWKKIGLGGILEQKENIQTLDTMIKENGHTYENNMILKMDIEGAEWNSLKDISEETLLQFKYILIEYHFTQLNHKLYYKILKKIHKTHQVFYLHCCPFTQNINFGFNTICQAIEVSYIIRQGNNFVTDDTIYPIANLSYGIHHSLDVNIFKLFDDYKI